MPERLPSADPAPPTPDTPAARPEFGASPEEQLVATIGVILWPRETLSRLPSTDIYALAFLGPMYFAFDRVIQNTGWEFWLFKAVVVVVVGLAAVPGWAWVLRHFLKLFGKRLTVVKLMNIGGYALVPRLLLALLATPLAFVDPERVSQVTVWLVLGLGMVALAYSLFLMVFGIVVSPSEDGE